MSSKLETNFALVSYATITVLYKYMNMYNVITLTECKIYFQGPTENN